MTTHLYFIRHARSVWNDAGRWQGQADPPLGESGLAQARRLAERLRSGPPIDHLYASDLQRASATASLVAEATGLTLTLDPIWRERRVGEWEGLTTEEIATRYPEAWASRLRGPLEAPGGETLAEVMQRATQACAGLLERHPDQSVAVVSHGGMILAALVHLLGLGPSGFALLVGGRNTAISHVIVEDGHARLDRLNDYAHLELPLPA
jgi:broad specificity phosphatase PhoE